MIQTPDIRKVLDSFSPIMLDEMENVKLMDRIETKYILLVNRIPEFLHLLDGEYKILEINEKRLFSYSTTYLDTTDWFFYNQHVTGRLERNKVRYRKYENTGTTFLEVKKRTNKKRTVKWRIKIDQANNNIYDDKAVEFVNKHIPQKNFTLNPVLISRFSRITLVKSELNERITIDYDMSFSSINGTETYMPYLAVIELKKQKYASRSLAGNMLKELSIQPTGFSKYCIGNALLYDLPHRNILKAKFLMINKIENEYNRSVYA